MARQDRLMRLMNALRRLPAPVTAARLAVETEISPRQLYRDIATLRAGGALIDGAPGLGYALTEDPVLPPQSFSRIEIEALMLAIGSLDHLGDATLSRAGRDAVARIIATLPDRQARQAMHTVLRTWRPTDSRPEVAVDMDLLRRACWEETSLWIRYRDQSERRNEREVWPLGLSYGPDALMLLAFCQLRKDYRLFHVARIEELRMEGNGFRPRRTELLRAYVAHRRADAGRVVRTLISRCRPQLQRKIEVAIRHIVRGRAGAVSGDEPTPRTVWPRHLPKLAWWLPTDDLR